MKRTVIIFLSVFLFFTGQAQQIDRYIYKHIGDCKFLGVNNISFNAAMHVRGTDTVRYVELIFYVSDQKQHAYIRDLAQFKSAMLLLDSLSQYKGVNTNEYEVDYSYTSIGDLRYGFYEKSNGDNEWYFELENYLGEPRYEFSEEKYNSPVYPLLLEAVNTAMRMQP